MTSRLVDQSSAYLRSAADQPVDWFPWGADAFERAREHDKPVLLDIGAVWCHWCHVMDHESYEDPEIAKVLNREWVCIKVDRDERPDVDARYQRAVQALTGQGGWPLTVFLTPDGAVFFGGTYFPPDGKYERPGFRSVLMQLAHVYREQREQVHAQATEIAAHLRQRRGTPPAGELSPDILSRAADGMRRLFDPRHGGFGDQPKFPHPSACEFLLDRGLDTADTQLLDIVHTTLTAMAEGGIRDHLGGGFHRYAVDARWMVPHFEKMLYDNSELLRAYVHAATAPAAPALYHDVIEGIVTWVSNVMSDPAGGYYGSQDADTGPDDDGDYFTWTVDEVRAVTSAEEFTVLADHYGIGERGEMRHDPQRNVLWIGQPVEETARRRGEPTERVAALLETGREKLRAARDRRPSPFVDTTIYTGWNALMASAMLEAAAHLDRPEVERHALETLERCFTDTTDGAAGLPHSPNGGVAGILEDQVYGAMAALDAFEVTGRAVWLGRAERLMEHVWDAYRHENYGLLDRERDRGGEGLLAQEIVPVQDSPTPSPNGMAGIVLARLAEHTRRADWRTRLEELLGGFAGGAADLSVFGATLHRAFAWALLPATHVVVVGPDDGETSALHRTARRIHRPRKVLHRLAPNADPSGLPGALRAMLDGAAPRAYVCAGTQCAPPAETADGLADTLQTFGLIQP
ncbi:MAG: thioredoxin domain-containing protein [Gemmatimonadales bacterium]|jgi:uncharacterized protein YyaL (SSP411 family)